MNAARPYIPTLDGWRAIAILGVMACHASGYFFSAVGLFPHPAMHAYLSHGSLGVDVFFVLSGFLICSGLVHEHESSGTISLRAFYVRRAFRILPPYFLYLAIVVVLARIGFFSVSNWELAGCLLFFRNFIRAPGWYTTHFWTLAVEEHFYLLFPTALLFSFKRRASLWIFAILAVTTALRVANANGKALGAIFTNPNFNPAGEDRINELILGAWLALAMRLPALQALARRAPSMTCVVVAAAVVYSTAHPLPLQVFMLPLALGALIVLTSSAPQSVFGRCLELRALRWIGRLSYSLYLWQQLFFVLDIPPSSLPLGVLQRWPLAPFAVFACASASYYCVERPCVQMGKRKSALLIARSS